MTTEKIIEAQNLIAGIRDDLAVLAATTDADKLVALVFEKTQRVKVAFRQLRPLVWRFAEATVVAEYHWTMETVKEGLYVMMALAQMSERRPELKAKLFPTVAHEVPRMDAHLDKIAQALREKAGESK